MGTINAVQSRIVVLAINDGGTVKLAAVNIAGDSRLDETTLITTTAAVAAGNSATAYYSTAVATSVAYRVVGYIESTQATAGTWASAPTTIQGMGGQALTAMSSLGYGQSWQNVTGSRLFGTTYYNTTAKPIQVGFHGTSASTSWAFADPVVDGVTIAQSVAVLNQSRAYLSFIVPTNMGYSISNSGTAMTIVKWSELR
jgi:hypothetical protein